MILTSVVPLNLSYFSFVLKVPRAEKAPTRSKTGRTNTAHAIRMVDLTNTAVGASLETAPPAHHLDTAAFEGALAGTAGFLRPVDSSDAEPSDDTFDAFAEKQAIGPATDDEVPNEAEEEAERALLEAARRANLAVEIQIRAMLSCLDTSLEPPASSQVEIAGSSHVFSAALPITA
jgi:hypothetical protein